MQNSPLRTLLGTLAVLIVIGVGAYVYIRKAPQSMSPTASTTTQTLSDGTVVSGLPEGATVKEETVTQSPTAPDYHKPVVFGAGVSPEVKAAVNVHVSADIATLDKSKTNFNAWMDLATVHKIGGDYHGAETIWLYVTKMWPTSAVAFNNLADLYQNFLSDSAKAKIYSTLAAKLTQ